MVRLLHGCCKLLRERGMAGMLVDGVRMGGHGFESLGKWNERATQSIRRGLTRV
jgi:hypothetical protein